MLTIGWPRKWKMILCKRKHVSFGKSFTDWTQFRMEVAENGFNMANVWFLKKKNYQQNYQWWHLHTVLLAIYFTVYIEYTAWKGHRLNGKSVPHLEHVLRQENSIHVHVNMYCNSGEKRRVIYNFCKICNISTQVQSPEFWVTVHSNI